MNCGCTNTVGEEKNIPQTAHIRTNLTDAKPPLRTNQDRCISRGARKVKKRPFSGHSICNDRVAAQPSSKGYVRRTAKNGCRTVTGEGASYAAIAKGKSPITS
jgi:hypothetical protein